MDEKPILLDLETLYLGIPDDSVNLTFQDLANVNTSQNRKQTTKITTHEHVSHVSNNIPTRGANSSPSLAKIRSFDFSQGLQASIQHNHHHQDIGHRVEANHGHVHVHDPQFIHASGVAKSPHSKTGGDDRSTYSLSFDVSVASGRGGGGGGGRPGIPHSKICTICSTYVYVFRTRCLVCGRAYCCRCVKIGMGEMVEGRKCIECLGLKFSQRYIERAGKVGCCNWRYPNSLKQAELMCAEKGPRRSRRSYGQSGVANSTSRSPITPRSPRTPRSPHAIGSTNEHSFVLSNSFSPFSPHHNNLPF